MEMANSDSGEERRQIIRVEIDGAQPA